jgi:hypothetical protein
MPHTLFSITHDELQKKNLILLVEAVGLSYRKRGSGGYAQTRRFKGLGQSLHQKHQPEANVPPETKRFYEAVDLKAAGEWSRGLLEKTETGRILKEGHMANVAETLKKAGKPKDEKELEETFMKALATPQQRFVVLYEAGLHGPLTPKLFTKYMSLFRELFPIAYKSVYGSKMPEQITASSLKGKL